MSKVNITTLVVVGSVAQLACIVLVIFTQDASTVQGQGAVLKMLCEVQGQDHVRSLKYCIGYVRHMFYGLFCSQNAMWTLNL